MLRVGFINFEGMQFRRDIGRKAVVGAVELTMTQVLILMGSDSDARGDVGGRWTC